MFPKISVSKKSVYLDYAATTPVDPKVLKTMAPFFTEKFGNPSSLYEKGREAKLAIELSRKSVADLIGARPSEIIFTAGGTESVNLAIIGVALKQKTGHVIASTIEHHSVLNSLEALKNQGYKTTLVGVNGQGFVDLEKLKQAIRKDTLLISVMMANNEIGTVQPVMEIGKWLARINTERVRHGLKQVLLHTDACQAAGFLELNVNHLGVDLMSVNGSKMYGPKQTGFLYVRSGVRLSPLIYGGGQEHNLRSGTENVVGVVGLVKAFELANEKQEKENQRLMGLSEYLIKKIKTKIPNVLLNGPDSFELKMKNVTRFSSRTSASESRDLSIIRLPNNVNFIFKNLEGEALMLYLDSYGFSVSTGSACSTSETTASHVLKALGRSELDAKGSVRFSLGKYTSKADLDKLLKVLPTIVSELRKVKRIIK